MNQIAAKIYYLKSTGKVLVITSECQGSVEPTTKEQDMELYEQLKVYNIDEVEYIELEYGTLADTFKNIKSYSVDVENKKFMPIYYTSEELNTMEQDFLKQQQEVQALQDRISLISEYALMDANSIDHLENAIIEYETNKIMNGAN